MEEKPALAALQSLREQMPFAFIAVASADENGAVVATPPALRYDLYANGASMVTHVKEHVVKMLETLAVSHPTGGDAGLRCPSCRLSGFTEDQLWCHLPAYHTADDRICMVYGTCPACGLKRTNIPRHFHAHHGPAGRGEAPSERDEVPPLLHAFSLVVCRRPSDGRFLVVQEFAGKGYWVPGGHVDAGETLRDAAVRETLEEAGVRVELKGIIKIEHLPRKGKSGRSGPHTRLRVTFYAEPADEGAPEKTFPDYESAGAAWVHLGELEGLPLRGEEPEVFFRHVEEGRPIAGMELLEEL